MKKSTVLGIGCGGCGNNLLNEFLSLDKRYTGIFMNTNLSEMENLEHFDRDRRCFYIPNADGTGKNRDLCESYVKEEAPKFAEMIKKFTGQNTIIFFTSGNGGTGSKAVALLSMVTKKLCPEKVICVVATMPSIKESDIDFENAIDFWNDIIKLKEKGIINNIQLIDNNKSLSEQSININSMKELNSSFEVVEGKLDSSDLKRYHHSIGYKVILNLENKYTCTSEAIDKAIENSVYFIPENLDCDVVVGNINTKKFDIAVIRDKFKAFEFVKFNEKSEGTSTILLGGCSMPIEAMDLVQEALKELRDKKKQRVKHEESYIRKETKIETKKYKQVEEVKSNLSSNDLDNLFSDDSVWN